MFGEEGFVLGVAPRPVSGEARGALRLPLPAPDRVELRSAHRRGRVDAVETCAVEAEDLGLRRLRQGLVAVPLDERIRDLEGAECLDLVLRRAVPDRVRAPEHVVLADIAQELSERMR